MTDLKLYNTLTRQKEVFVPLDPNEVTMYVCGPTVYDLGHLGHGRSMVAFDLVRRYLEYCGYKVNFTTNFTDIDDKMIKRAAEENIEVKELAARIGATYVEDYAKLGVKDPTNRPSATEYITEMMVLVKKLLAKDFAYKLDDGVYFDITKFVEYGKLSGQNLEELDMGARVEIDEAKRNPQDFALWKNKKAGEPSWTDEDGILEEGRPGWHIECSAMIWAVLGETIDIHGGGSDLTFPHHECEIAQSETALETDFVKYWLHNGFVRVNGEKMSKSLGNFKTLRDLFAEYDPLVLRYALISVHYRGPVEFTPAVLTQAEASLGRLREFVGRIKNAKDGESNLSDRIERMIQEFVVAMNDDFEISKALAAIFTFVHDVNIALDQEGLSRDDQGKILEAFAELDKVLGLELLVDLEIPESVKVLLGKRADARAASNYQLSDELRDQIAEYGFVVKDTSSGQEVQKKLQ